MIPPRPMSAVKLPALTQKKLNIYALSAGAVAIGVLTLPHPAQAEIVYTPANEVLNGLGSIGIDFNHDGIVDVVIEESSTQNSSTFTLRLQAVELRGNGVVGPFGARALYAGSLIGPSRVFHGEPMATAIDTPGEATGQTIVRGYWPNVTNRYLGVKFRINGDIHYGWARLTVTSHRGFIATLTGYAYETVPDRPILAGLKRYPKDDSLAPQSLEAPPTSQQSILGLLAAGSAGINTWRATSESRQSH